MELNIFNGDCAYEAWRKSGETSPILVWRESYLEGRIPGPDTPLEEFEQIRAEELHKCMPELNFEKLLNSLRKMDQALAGLSADDSVVLWFDACMYDQTMLSRILFLLNGTPASVFLICEDIAWGNFPELFAEKKCSALRLSESDIALYASAWKAFAGGAGALKQLLAEKEAERFPFLAKALARYLEELPAADGLSRSERQLLEIIRSGKHVGIEIFRALGDYEEHPFMGDTMCWRLLAGLAEKGFITIQSDEAGKKYYLTPGH